MIWWIDTFLKKHGVWLVRLMISEKTCSKDGRTTTTDGRTTYDGARAMLQDKALA